MALAKSKLTRTVQYWRLVDGSSHRAVAEQDWHGILKTAHGKPITQLILSKEVTGTVLAMEPATSWPAFLQPQGLDGLAQGNDGAVYALTASTDKDHIPSQSKRGTGEQKPVTVDQGFAPVDNLFVWFLPFGNIMAILQESVSSARAQAIATWMTHLMRAQNALPQHNFQWAADPVIDEGRRQVLAKAHRLRRIQVGGTVVPSETGPLRELFTGAHFEGEYEVELKIRHVKSRNPRSYARDTEETMDWFKAVFGDHLSDLHTAKVIVDRTSDDIPKGEIDLLAQRMTRKRTIELGKRGKSIVAMSAVSEIVEAYIQDFEDLVKLR